MGSGRSTIIFNSSHFFGISNQLIAGFRGTVSRITKGCVDLLVPARCVNCSALIAPNTGVCANCWQQMRFIERPFCSLMGTPFTVDLGDEIISTEAIAHPPPFRRLRCAVIYDDISRSLISRYKFSDRTDLAPFIANVMARAGGELINDADMIVALPLHWRRLHARRFNQSAHLAKLISDQCAVPFEPLILQRIKNTKQQIGLTFEGRRQNVAGAFKVSAESRPFLKGKNVLLVDDVYTSGATVKAATKSLLRAGAGAVDVLAFAKVHSDTV